MPFGILIIYCTVTVLSKIVISIVGSQLPLYMYILFTVAAAVRRRQPSAVTEYADQYASILNDVNAQGWVPLPPRPPATAVAEDGDNIIYYHHSRNNKKYHVNKRYYYKNQRDHKRRRPNKKVTIGPVSQRNPYMERAQGKKRQLQLGPALSQALTAGPVTLSLQGCLNNNICLQYMF